LTEKALAQKLSGSRYAEGTTSASAVGTPTKSTATKFTLADEAASNQLIQQVRDDAHALNWIAWNYQNQDPNTAILEALHICGSGSGGYAEFEKLFTAQPSQVLFGLLAIPIRLEGDQELFTTKYLLVTWVGTGTRPLAKAKSAVDRVALYAHINKFLQLGAEWQAQEFSEISEAKVIAKLSGSVLQEEKSVSMEKTVKATISDGISRANMDYRPDLVQNTGKIDLDNPDAGVEALKKLRDSIDNTNWIAFGYKEGSKLMTLLGSGTGGYSELEQTHFQDKNVVYAFLAMVFGPEYGGLVKWVFISWTGPKAKPTQKSLSAMHRVSLYNWSQTTLIMSGEYQALSKEEISEELIKKKIIGTKILTEEEQKAVSSPSTSRARSATQTVEKFDFVDQEAVDKAIQEVRSDGTNTNWLVIDHESAQSSRLQLAQTGKGGLEDIRALLGDDKVVYIILGTIQDEGDYSQVKYLFITWVGSLVSPLHKARSSMTRTKLYQHASKFMTLAGEVQILDPSELSVKTLISKLSGSRMVSEADTRTAQREAKVVKGSMEKIKFEDDAALQSTLEKLRRDGGDVDWVVLGYPEEPGKNDVIRIIASGAASEASAEPLVNVKTHFLADKSRYAIIAYQVTEIVDDVDYTRKKNVFLSWVGEGVKPLAKARASQHLPHIVDAVGRVVQLHAQVYAEKEEELSEDTIMEKLTGSRKQDASKIQKEADRIKQREAAEARVIATAKSSSAPVTVTEIKTIFPRSEVLEQFETSLKELRDDANPANWVALAYEGNNGEADTLFVLGKGEGGLTEASTHFKDDTVIYAIIGVKDEDYAKVLRYIFVTFVGPQVKPIRRALSSQHRVAVYAHSNNFLQLAGEIGALTRDDVATEQQLRDKLAGSRVKASQD
jgi:hypothetical protein